MGHWIRMSTLTEEGVKKLRHNHTQLFTEVKQAIEGEGGTLVAAWVTQGKCDLVSVIDAPDEQAMLAIDAAVSSLRIYHSTTMPGIPIDSFLSALNNSHFGMFLEGWMSKRKR